MPVTGGPIQRIAPLGLRPRFSPDGKWIAYWTGPEGSTDLFSPGLSHAYIVPATGGAPRLIAPELPAAAYPVWTKDSSAVLIPAPADISRGLQGIAIWVAPIDGGPARQAIPASRFREWKIAGQPANSKLFYLSGFPVGVSRNSGLVIPTPIERHTEVWEFPLTPGTWTSNGAPKQFTTLPALEGFPALGPNGAVFFEELVFKISLWERPIDYSGPGRELLTCPRGFCQPILSRDGNRMLFTILQKSGAYSLTVKELPNGRETALTVDGADFKPHLSSDGKRAFYSELSVESLNRPRRLYRINTSGGPPEVVCEACPALSDVSADGRYVLGTDFKPRQVVLVDLQTGAQASLLRHPAWSLSRPRFSPDGSSIAFTAQGDAPGTRILVAPFDPGRIPAPEEWIAITPGDTQDGPVVWSPRGDALYFASERDGYRCLWIQRLHPNTKRPFGDAQTVQHFHDTRLSLKSIPSSWFSFSVARDKIVYELGERTGRIWMTR